MKKVSFFFAAFIVLIIVLADLGRLPPFLSDLYAFPGGDKLGHFLLYGILAFLLVIAVPPGKQRSPWLSPLQICCFLVLGIGIEEISQHVLHFRSADIVDFACSAVGVAVFGFLGWRVKRRQTSSRPE